MSLPIERVVGPRRAPVESVAGAVGGVDTEILEARLVGRETLEALLKISSIVKHCRLVSGHVSGDAERGVLKANGVLRLATISVERPLVKESRKSNLGVDVEGVNRRGLHGSYSVRLVD